MLVQKNIKNMFSTFDETWTPKVCGEVNNTHIKVAKFEGEFVWHSHANEDEMFLVVSGRLRMELRCQPDIVVSAGEFLIVPKGTEHRPVAEVPTEVILIEPKQTLNTGEIISERTVVNLENI
jgi:mannose-6-phosphate isomerase-like protein (cupin superfamily)